MARFLAAPGDCPYDAYTAAAGELAFTAPCLGRSLNNIAGSGAQLFGLALGGAVVAVLGPRRALAVSAPLYLGCA